MQRGIARSYLLVAAGLLRRGRADSAEGVGAQSGKGAHSTQDGNPYGWLALGRGARGRGFGNQTTFIWLEEECIDNTYLSTI